MSAIPGALGFTQNVGNQNNGLDQQQAMLQARANNPNGIATQAYQGMANQRTPIVRRGDNGRYCGFKNPGTNRSEFWRDGPAGATS